LSKRIKKSLDSFVLSSTGAQRKYDELLRGEEPFLFCIGPAGTGKTMLAVREGLRRLEMGKVRVKRSRKEGRLLRRAIS